jgi:hypothetical protein
MLAALSQVVTKQVEVEAVQQVPVEATLETLRVTGGQHFLTLLQVHLYLMLAVGVVDAVLVKALRVLGVELVRVMELLLVVGQVVLLLQIRVQVAVLAPDTQSMVTAVQVGLES